MSDFIHVHKYYAFQVKYEFEPLPEGNNLYRRVEYSYSVCNCGRAIKSKVVSKDEI